MFVYLVTTYLISQNLKHATVISNFQIELCFNRLDISIMSHSPMQRFYKHKSQNIFCMNHEILHSTKTTKVICNTVMILGKNKKTQMYYFSFDRDSFKDPLHVIVFCFHKCITLI